MCVCGGDVICVLHKTFGVTWWYFYQQIKGLLYYQMKVTEGMFAVSGPLAQGKVMRLQQKIQTVWDLQVWMHWYYAAGTALSNRRCNKMNENTCCAQTYF